MIQNSFCHCSKFPFITNIESGVKQEDICIYLFIHIAKALQMSCIQIPVEKSMTITVLSNVHIPHIKKIIYLSVKKIKQIMHWGVGYRKIRSTEFESLFCQTRFSSFSHHISHRKCGNQLLKNRLIFLMHYIAYIYDIRYIYIYLFFH